MDCPLASLSTNFLSIRIRLGSTARQVASHSYLDFSRQGLQSVGKYWFIYGLWYSILIPITEWNRNRVQLECKQQEWILQPLEHYCDCTALWPTMCEILIKWVRRCQSWVVTSVCRNVYKILHGTEFTEHCCAALCSTSMCWHVLAIVTRSRYVWNMQWVSRIQCDSGATRGVSNISGAGSPNPVQPPLFHIRAADLVRTCGWYIVIIPYCTALHRLLTTPIKQSPDLLVDITSNGSDHLLPLRSGVETAAAGEAGTPVLLQHSSIRKRITLPLHSISLHHGCIHDEIFTITFA